MVGTSVEGDGRGYRVASGEVAGLPQQGVTVDRAIITAGRFVARSVERWTVHLRRARQAERARGEKEVGARLRPHSAEGILVCPTLRAAAVFCAEPRVDEPGGV